MGEILQPLSQEQPVSIHHTSAHPIAIAAAVVFLPILICLVAGGLLLANLNPKVNSGLAPVPEISEPSALLHKYQVAQARSRSAVCNDGSPATYYYRPGSAENLDKWIVFLEGGNSCATDASCQERYLKDKHRVSSNNYPDVLSQRGIFDENAEENPDFWNFNHVYVKYCSSDNWSGDTEHLINGEIVQFRGANIVTAVFEDLAEDAYFPTANLSQASTVILAGSDSGGVGVAHQLDKIAAALPDIKVSGISDSAWNPSAETQELSSLNGWSYWNSQLDASCLATHGDNPNLCFRVDTAYPYLDTPLFIFVDQSDKQLLTNLNVTDVDAMAAVSAAIRASLEPVTAAFSPDTGVHTALTSGRFNFLAIEGETFSEILGNWFFNRSDKIKAITE